jgi:hypothetical protein
LEMFLIHFLPFLCVFSKKTSKILRGCKGKKFGEMSKGFGLKTLRGF